jgi:hypothetical protein
MDGAEFDLKRSNVKKLNNVEVKEQCVLFPCDAGV